MDEIWFHHFQQEMKQQSKQWKQDKTEVRKQDNGLHFRRCRRSADGGLSRQGSHYYRGLLLLEKIKAVSVCRADKRNPLPLGQCSGTHVHSGHGCYPEMWISTCRRPTLFS